MNPESAAMYWGQRTKATARPYATFVALTKGLCYCKIRKCGGIGGGDYFHTPTPLIYFIGGNLLILKKCFQRCAFLVLAIFLAVSAYSQTAPAKSSAPVKSSDPQIDARDVPGRPPDDFAGLTLTNDQKAEIAEIHEDIKSRMDVVVKTDNLNADQKGAMLDGYRRMEQRQIFEVLTPVQQKEVRKKINAQRAQEQEKKKSQQSPPR